MMSRKQWVITGSAGGGVLLVGGIVGTLVYFSAPDPLGTQVESGILTYDAHNSGAEKLRSNIVAHYRLYREGKEALSAYPYVPNLLHLAAETEYDTSLLLPVVDELAAAGADVNALGTHGRSALHIASAHGLSAVADRLLALGADPRLKTSAGESVLHLAVSGKAPAEMLPLLLKCGAEVNMLHAADGVSPLSVALARGQDSAVELLLAAGADVNARSGSAESAFGTALLKRQHQVLPRLIEAGADVNAPMADGRMPLTVAVQMGEPAILNQLLQAKANVNAAATANGGPLVLSAAANGHEDMVELLLAAGEPPDARDSHGRTLLHYAISDTQVQRYIAAGLKVNEEDNEGYTPLMLVSRAGHAGAVQALLKAGAAPGHTVGQRGSRVNALNLATSPAVQELLQQAGCHKLISVSEAMSLLDRYDVIDTLDPGHIGQNIFTEEVYHDDSYSKISSNIQYHYRLYRDGREKLSDYNYLGAILMLHAKKPSRELPLECMIAFIENGAGLELLNGDNKSPMCLALEQGNHAVALALVEAGAQVNNKIPLSGYYWLWDDSYPLHVAAGNGYTELVRAMLAAGAKAGAESSRSKTTPLHSAAAKGHTEIVRMLLEAGANPRAALVTSNENNGCTPLHDAAAGGYLEIVRMLLEAGADPNARLQDGTTPVQKASNGGHTEVVKLLLAGKGKAEGISLSQAAKQDVALVRSLLEAGADVNAGEPLHHAAEAGKADIVKLLLEAGADVNAGNPLFVAASRGRTEIVRMLLEAGADVCYIQRDPQYTALTIAAKNGHMEIVRMIVETGRDKTSVSLLWAIMENNEEVCRAVLKAGADPNGEANSIYWNQPFLYMAVSRGNVNIVKALLDAGADPSKEASGAGWGSRNTPLYNAIEKGYTEIAIMLIKAGAPVQCKDILKNTQSPELELAMKKGNVEVFKALIRAKAHRGLDTGVDRATFTHRLVFYENADLMNAYLALGGAVDARDSKGASPLAYAVFLKKPAIVSALLRHGANPNHLLSGKALCYTMGDHLLVHDSRINYVNLSLLHLAAIVGNEDIVRALLKKGANPCYGVGQKGSIYPHDHAREDKIKDILLRAFKKKVGK